MGLIKNVLIAVLCTYSRLPHTIKASSVVYFATSCLHLRPSLLISHRRVSFTSRPHHTRKQRVVKMPYRAQDSERYGPDHEVSSVPHALHAVH
jgi:hypothetical protein